MNVTRLIFWKVVLYFVEYPIGVSFCPYIVLLGLAELFEDFKQVTVLVLCVDPQARLFFTSGLALGSDFWCKGGQRYSNSWLTLYTLNQRLILRPSLSFPKLLLHA